MLLRIINNTSIIEQVLHASCVFKSKAFRSCHGGHACLPSPYIRLVRVRVRVIGRQTLSTHSSTFGLHVFNRHTNDGQDIFNLSRTSLQQHEHAHSACLPYTSLCLHRELTLSCTPAATRATSCGRCGYRLTCYAFVGWFSLRLQSSLDECSAI